MLNEKGGGDSQDRHEQGTAEGFAEHGGVAAEKAQKPPPWTNRRASCGGGGCLWLRHEQQQVASPTSAELVAGQFLDAASWIGHDDCILFDPVQHQKVSEASLGLHVRDGGEGDLGQCL